MAAALRSRKSSVWWGRSEPLQVYLSPTRLWWRVGEGECRQSVHSDPLEALDRLAAESVRSSRCNVWLGGSLCQLALVDAVKGTRDRNDAEAAMTATLRARREVGPQSVVRLVQRPAEEGPVLAVKVDEPVMRRLEALYADRVRVRSVRPWWSAVLASRQPETGELATVAAFDGEQLLLVNLDKAGAIAVAASHAPIESGESCERALSRWLVAHPLQPVMRWQLGGGEKGSLPPIEVGHFAFSNRLVCRERF